MKALMRLGALVLLGALAGVLALPAWATVLRLLEVTTLTATTGTITTATINSLTIGTTTISGITVTGNSALGNGAADSTTVTGYLVVTTSVTAVNYVQVSSAAANATAMRIRGAYSSVQLSLLTPAVGDMVYNTTLFALCPSSGTGVGAWVLPRSTSTTASLIQCY